MMRRATRYHALGVAIVALLLTSAAVAGLVTYGHVVEQRKATYAAGLVQTLLNANTAGAPAIIAEMADYRRWTDPLLQKEIESAVPDSQRKLNASMAMLSVERGQVAYLYGRLLDAEPSQVPVLRDALAPYQEELLGKLWLIVESPAKGQERQRLRAAAALARYEPDSPRWTQVQGAVATDLVRVPAGYMAAWLDSLRPVRTKLLDPLAVIFRQGAREAERSLAADILADYAADQPRLLADLLMDADEQQFAVLYSVVAEVARLRGVKLNSGEFTNQINNSPAMLLVVTALANELDRKPSSEDDGKERLAKRQANAAVALLKLGQPAKAWPLMQSSSDPTARSYLIHRLSPLGADPTVLVKRLDEERDVASCRAMLLSLGEYSESEFPSEARSALLPKLQWAYRMVGDPGIHAAVEWLLRTWKQDEWLKQINIEWGASNEMREKARHGMPWYVTSQGQTMVVVPGPVEYSMGSPTAEPGRLAHEKEHRTPIGRTFAIADRPVTVEQFRRYCMAKFKRDHDYLKERAPSEDCPVHYTTWYMAAAYCNWLSEQDGISKDQWCYEMNALGQVTKLKENCLELTGYRLPTEAEWEYACRAGTSTRWHHGNAEELLDKYAWYLQNAKDRTWPVASKKPNDFGLFDMHGNVWSWCQETYAAYPDPLAEDRTPADLEVDVQKNRVLRGGAFDTQASTVRSASRYWYAPAVRSFSVGFRVARTIP
jgi:formylglycine-generating enzyme required for sulfatase activity